MSDTRIRFKDHTAEDLHQLLAPHGVDLRTARRLQSAVVRSGSNAIPAQMPEVPRRLLEQLRQITDIPRLQLRDRQVSPKDGFAKYLFEGDGEGSFEAVRIPLLHRPGDEKYIICVSSQVGCALGCAFCATGKLGFKRNLHVWEMIDQVMQIKSDSEYPVRGVVFMGMGEPMLNYDRVMKAAEVMSDPCGLAINARAITVSTAGVVPGIRRFTEERRPYRLIVSLTSANSEIRLGLMPIEATHPLPELIDAVRDYQAMSGERATLAWVAIAGVNTRPEDARQIAELTAGLPIILDIIEVSDASGQFQAPSTDELKSFRDALTVELGMPVIRRYSGGRDIDAGCGMLAGKSSQAEALTDPSAPATVSPS